MVRSLETGKNLGRGVDWLRVGVGTLSHLTWPLGARTGGAGRARNASPGEQRKLCIPAHLGSPPAVLKPAGNGKLCIAPGK